MATGGELSSGACVRCVGKSLFGHVVRLDHKVRIEGTPGQDDDSNHY